MNESEKVKNNFKHDVEKKKWKACVKFPGVLMVKKPGDRKYSVYQKF